jgi:acetylornithine/N-succinyldiaminopimelate aminotransferase
MSANSSDSPSEPSGSVEPLAGDPTAGGGPLDFSGSSPVSPANSAGLADCTNEPIGSPRSALDAAALADAFCAKLSSVSFGDRVYLLSSEAEAWRSAVETVRRYHAIVGRPKRRRFIVCAGASDATGIPPPGLEGDDEIIILRTDDHAALQAEIDARTAGILIAPVRTRACFQVVPGALLARLRETADEYGLMLGFDETVCGFGRSGMLWAHEWTGVTPDFMITSRWRVETPPLAALVVTQRVARGAPVRPPLAESATLLGANALLDDLSTAGFLERIQNRSWYLEDQLTALFYKRHGAFAALSGLGLMQGLICSRPREAEPMRAMLAERGILTRAMGSVIGLFPQLTVEEREIDAAVSAIDMVCARKEQ